MIMYMCCTYTQEETNCVSLSSKKNTTPVHKTQTLGQTTLVPTQAKLFTFFFPIETWAIFREILCSCRKNQSNRNNSNKRILHNTFPWLLSCGFLWWYSLEQKDTPCSSPSLVWCEMKNRTKDKIWLIIIIFGLISFSFILPRVLFYSFKKDNFDIQK